MSDVFPSSHWRTPPFLDTEVSTQWPSDGYGPKERKKIDRLLHATGSLTGLRILEPGCGAGMLTEVIAKKVGPTGCVIAMDVSPQMVAAARQRLSGCGNVKIYLGAAEARAKSLGYFDQIICHQVFANFIDPEKALKSLAETLNPYGLIVISQFTALAKINAFSYKAGKDKMQTLCKDCGLKVENCWDDEEMCLLSARLI